MMLFWILAGLMVAAALLMILPPLFGRQDTVSADRRQQNIIIARERLQELEQERDNGELSQEEFEAYRDELEQSLLDDVAPEQSDDQQRHVHRSRQSAIALIVLVPVAAIGLYLFLGEPVIMQQQASAARQVQGAGADKLPSIDTMVDQLARRLENNPDDAEGWALLAQSYMAIKDYSGAATAMENLYRLRSEDPNIILQYADALAMAQGRQLSGKPAELIEQALAIKPDHLIGLWMAGMVAEERGELQQAIDYWLRAEVQLDSEPESQQELRAMIRQAEAQLGVTPRDSNEAQPPAQQQASDVASIRVLVTLDPSLEQHVALNDTLFILARAVDGPPMPLAAVKRQAKELPLEVVLDDTMAMMPAMKLSNFDTVSIVARISKSGSTSAQSGDLEGEASEVSVGDGEPVKIVIQNMIP